MSARFGSSRSLLIRCSAWCAVLALGALAWAQPAGESADAAGDAGSVVLIRLGDEAIGPATARYIQRGMRTADQSGARALVVELDTPGGLLQSTHEIVRSILDADVPVMVYIAPSGARGASAGVFITYAAHVAAMAPGTHIGAAHPVSIGGGMPGSDPPPEDEQPQKEGEKEGADPDASTERSAPKQGDVMTGKIVNDAVAWVRSLAELRGRNPDWAERAVTESESITATQALELNAIDLVAPDVETLLREVDGRTVELAGGREATLRTADARVVRLDMWWGEKLLAVISSPNVAYLLLMFGFYGILFEFYTAGWGVGGTLGAICLLLGFFGLAYLPVNFAALALIALGLGMLVAEAFVVSFGALSAGGVLCLVFGGIMLVDSPEGWLRVSTWTVIPIALATAGITVFLVSKAAGALRGRAHTGSEAMIGAEARARTGFTPDGEGAYAGRVLCHGELWNARSAEPIGKGDRVTVTARAGMTLTVAPAPHAAPVP